VSHSPPNLSSDIINELRIDFDTDVGDVRHWDIGEMSHRVIGEVGKDPLRIEWSVATIRAWIDDDSLEQNIYSVINDVVMGHMTRLIGLRFHHFNRTGTHIPGCELHTVPRPPRSWYWYDCAKKARQYIETIPDDVREGLGRMQWESPQSLIDKLTGREARLWRAVRDYGDSVRLPTPLVISSVYIAEKTWYLTQFGRSILTHILAPRFGGSVRTTANWCDEYFNSGDSYDATMYIGEGGHRCKRYYVPFYGDLSVFDECV
jgi:hypothetical protein